MYISDKPCIYIQGESQVCRAAVRVTFTCPSADQPIASKSVYLSNLSSYQYRSRYIRTYIMSLVCIIRMIKHMISHACIFKMIGRSAGRHIDMYLYIYNIW